MVGSTEVSVNVMASDLVVPWDLVLGPDGFIWFTQVGGEVYRMDPANGALQLVYTETDVVEFGYSAGMHSMAFHPDFANEPYVYLHYTNSTSTSVIRRYLYDDVDHTMTETGGHLLSMPIAAGASHNGSRIIIDSSGMFLICLGETINASASAQDPNTSHGKILRFTPDGSIPADNPVAGSYVYNWGHRNPQGMVLAPNGISYNAAHGQNNDDEVNIVLPNRNNGWPTVLGLCNTPTEVSYCTANNVVEPIHEFTTEVVAPCGMDYFDHPSIPGWQNSLLVATLRGKEIRQLQLNLAGDAVLEDNTFLSQEFGRFRDVLVHPDGRIFLCTSNRDYIGVPIAADDRILVLQGNGGSTGVTGPEDQEIHIYPNPTNAILHIDRTVPVAELSVHALDGSCVLEPVLNTDQLDISSLTTGLYLVLIRTKDGRLSRMKVMLHR